MTTPLLSEAEQGRLALIATVVHFGTGEALFRVGDKITWIYNLSHGVVRTYSSAPDGRRTLLAFLFPEDLVGLAENGRYTATAEAVNPVTAYRLPVTTLERLMRHDPELELHFLCKVCHELREAQRHAILLARKDARGKVALFLHLLLNQHGGGLVEAPLTIPMSRADIADYVGLSIEAVSRAFRMLERNGILRFQSPQVVEFVDRKRFDTLIAAADLRHS